MFTENYDLTLSKQVKFGIDPTFKGSLRLLIKIVITASEAIAKGIWDELCELRGWNPWIVNEGRMPSDEEIVLTEKEVKELGIC